MLIKFSCKAHADITMFGNIGLQLIKLMGHSGTVPSAILAADVPAALEHLQAALESDRRPPQADEAEDGEDGEPAVSLANRAVPLVELLQAAAAEKCNVMWREG